MARITISYRREDSGVITGRIFDRLVTHYGRDSIFRDIDNIPLGVDFHEQINEVLDKSDIVLAIVGPQWIGPRRGQSRLANEADPVRLEVEAVLRRKVPLIPVLVLRAAMPRVDQLPDSLKDFAYRNGIQVDASQDFDNHIARLTRAMDRLLDMQFGPAGTASLPRAPTSQIVLPVAPPGEADAVDIAEEETILPPLRASLVEAVPDAIVPPAPVPAIDLPAPQRHFHRAATTVLVVALGIGAGFGLDYLIRPT